MGLFTCKECGTYDGPCALVANRACPRQATSHDEVGVIRALDLIMYGNRRQVGPCVTLPSLVRLATTEHPSTDISVRIPRT